MRRRHSLTDQAKKDIEDVVEEFGFKMGMFHQDFRWDYDLKPETFQEFIFRKPRRLIDKLVCQKNLNYYAAFDVGPDSQRITICHPGDDDLEHETRFVDKSQEARLNTVRGWLSRVRDLVAPELTSKPQPTQGPAVMYMQAGKPYTAHMELEPILRGLTGEARVCDPFLGESSLSKVGKLTNCSSVRFLTRQPQGPGITSVVTAFKAEHPFVEFRQNSGRDFHDRFILTADELIILGHGLKDVGRSDSFVIRLPATLAPDMVDEVRNAFDQRWAAATVIA